MKYKNWLVSALVVLAAFAFYFGYVRPTNAAEYRGRVVKYMAERVAKLKGSCETLSYDFDNERNSTRAKGEVHWTDDIAADVEGMRAVLPDIQPAEIGLRTYEEIKEINKVCFVKEKKKELSELFNAPMTCEGDVPTCEKKHEQLEIALSEFEVRIKSGFYSLAEIGMSSETDFKVGRAKVIANVGKAYEKILAAYPSDYDHPHHGPTWLADKVLLLYKQAEVLDISVQERVVQLKKNAYARRVSYMLRQLAYGVEYPHSEVIAAKIREAMAEVGFKLEEFGFDDAKFRRLIGKDPRIAAER